MPLRTGGRPSRTLAEHEVELRARMNVLGWVIDNPDADPASLRAWASLVRSGCDAYMRRLDVADASERAEPASTSCSRNRGKHQA